MSNKEKKSYKERQQANAASAPSAAKAAKKSKKVAVPEQNFAPVPKKKVKHPAPAPSEVDITKEGDPKTPIHHPGLTTTKFPGEQKPDISKASVVEPTAVSDLEDQGVKTREEKVVATRRGYYGHRLREPGDVFIMYFKGNKGFLPSWVRLAEDDDIETQTVEVKPAKGKKPAVTKEVEVLDGNRASTSLGGTATNPDDATRTVI